MKTIILFTSFLLTTCALYAQTKNSITKSPNIDQSSLSDIAITNITKQLTLYPKEKLHIQIDRSTYLPGDTLWIKAYTAHATFHSQLPTSRYVYVELINPVDSLLQRAKLRRDSLGNITGYLLIPHRVPEGEYGLRAYTRYMLQENEDYLFERSLQIGPQPEWLHTQLAASALKRDSKTTFDFTLFDNTNKSMIIPKAEIILPQGKVLSAPCLKEKVTSTFRRKEMADNSNFLLRLSGLGTIPYERYFALSSEQEDYDVNFYPEGGYLIADTECRVAYRALDMSGNSINIRIFVQDDTGHTLLTDSTLHDGMGCFTFSPKASKKYKIMAINRHQLSKSFELPPIQKTAYALRAEIRANHHLHLTTLTAINMPTDSLLLVVSIRGAPFYVAPITNTYTVIDLSTCPTGIIQCLLLDNHYNKLSERLCFHYRSTNIQCQWHTNKDSYIPKEKIEIKLRFTDSLNCPISGNFSVSITDSKAEVTDISHNILSSFLLTTELKGYINNPAFYFDSNNPIATKALDLLLMTHDWKRYNLPQIIKGKFKQPREQPEISSSISGKLKTSGLLSKVKQGEVSLINKMYNFQCSTLSTPEGAFRFDGFEFPDGVEFILKARSLEEDRLKRRKLVVEVEPEIYARQMLKFPQEVIHSNKQHSPLYYDKPIVTYINGMAHVQLNSITIKPTRWGSNDYREMNRHEIMSLKEKKLSRVLANFGIKIVNLKDIDYLFYNKTWVRVFINGFPYLEEALEYISPEDVENIQFIGDMDWKYFLLWTCNNHYLDTPQYYNPKTPVLDLTLKPTFDPRHISMFQKIDFGYHSYGLPPQTHQTEGTSIYPLGYQTPAAFYAPQYESKQKSENMEVYPTLFWEPNLQTNPEGCTTFSFYAPANSPTILNVILEGLTEKGELVYATKKIVVTEDKIIR